MQRTGSRRSTRIADLIMRELGEMLVHEVSDPRLELVTISGVRMNRDLRIAQVLFTVHGGKDMAVEAKEALDKARGYLRSNLGKRLKMKYLPDLRFEHDGYLEDMIYDHGAGEDSRNS